MKWDKVCECCGHIHHTHMLEDGTTQIQSCFDCWVWVEYVRERAWGAGKTRRWFHNTFDRHSIHAVTGRCMKCGKHDQEI